jgi:hypothetical protein
MTMLENVLRSGASTACTSVAGYKMAAMGGFSPSAIRGGAGGVGVGVKVGGGGEAVPGAIDETQQRSFSTPLVSLTLNIQMKFLIPNNSKARADPKDTIDITIDSDSWSMDKILVCVREHVTYRNRIIDLFGRDVDSESLASQLLCQGVQLFDDTDARKQGSYNRMLEQARYASSESTPVCALVLKIFKKDSALIPSTPQPQSRGCGEERAFLNYLSEQRWLLLRDFDHPHFEATNLYKTALKLGDSNLPADVIDNCIKELSRLGVQKKECEGTRKKWIMEELDTQRDAFEIGKVRPLDAKRFPGASWTPEVPPVSNDQGPSEVRREKKWPWDLRLHHKLHDMLMFDVAELELDGQPYTGKATLPKRDKKVEKSAPLKLVFAEVLGRNPGSSTIERGRALQILKRELACVNDDTLQAYIGADPAAPVDEAAFLELAQKLQARKLTSVRTSLTQAISESKGLGCSNLEIHLQESLKALQTFEDLHHASAEEDCWYTKKNPTYNLQDILQCWRNATKIKKVMPLPLSTLCKQAFADKSITLNGSRTITLKLVKLILEDFAHDANQAEMDDLNRRIEDDNHAFIGEEEYLEIVKRLQLTAGAKDVVEFYDKLIKIETQRRESGRPPKLEFSKLSDKDNRSLELHRILGVGFNGQIQVTCCPMEKSLRQDYSGKIEFIHKRIEEIDAQLKAISSDMKVLSSFLFVLVGARMHRTVGTLNSELAATCSLGIVGIKIYKNFITESLWKAEQEAYFQLGLTNDILKVIFSLEGSSKSDEKTNKDEKLLQMRFRQLLLVSFPKKDVTDAKDAKLLKLLREPLSRLRKFPKPSVKEPKLEMSASDGETFSVATVTNPSPHATRIFL